MHTWDLSGRVQSARPPSGTSVFLWCHAFDMEPVTRNPWVCAHQELPLKEGDLMDSTTGGSQGHQRMPLHVEAGTSQSRTAGGLSFRGRQFEFML